ncbi:MAG: hypothetical protein QOK32_1599 [Gaiellaceae bacterium]|nr:hypothetical protein [Gaiellaceae bacterium]MDX6517279.1 hypothetical protein [Gaiellaceae bacterium]MDX6543996.1 hypothetical protein [Gaiellaceae bacterium]
MTEPSLSALSRDERRRRRRQNQISRWAVRGAIALALFALGIAVGQSLQDNPRPTGPFTQVRTIPPVRPATTT